jgi:hypothetical protein
MEVDTMPSVTSKDCKQAYSSEEQADEFVNDYLLHSAKKGRRNSTLFLARCAYRDAGESIEDARERSVLGLKSTACAATKLKGQFKARTGEAAKQRATVCGTLSVNNDSH